MKKILIKFSGVISLFLMLSNFTYAENQSIATSSGISGLIVNVFILLGIFALILAAGFLVIKFGKVKMTIGKKLLFGFLTLILIMVFVGIVSYNSFRHVEEDFGHVDRSIHEVQAILNIKYLATKTMDELADIYITRELEGISTINSVKEKFRKNLQALKKNSTAGQALLINKVDTESVNLYKVVDEMIIAARAGKWKDFKNILGGRLDNRIKALEKAIEKTVIAVEREIDKDVGDVKSIITGSILIMIIVILIAAVIGILLAIITTRSITLPIKQGIDIAGRISKKDLSGKVENVLLKRSDEIGDLSNALNVMQKNLIVIIEEMQDVSSNLAASSEEMSSTAQNLADGAQNQAASVEETSASIEELNSSVESVSANADDVNKKAVELSEVAKQSSDLIDNVLISMKRIADSSEQISEIINVINDVSDQTNLLALNAAIEAARAGEHGRGFAVVADEISKLADKSAENSKEIEKLISVSMKDVENGVEIVQKSGEAFREIIVGVDTNNELMDDIAKSIKQQRDGTNQVQISVESINEITQNTSASAEEMAASTEQLHAQIEKIREMFDEFQISNGKAIEASEKKEINYDEKHVTLIE